jgi:hypothetical protein
MERAARRLQGMLAVLYALLLIGAFAVVALSGGIVVYRLFRIGERAK